MSPVSFETPAPSPPVETSVIRSVFDSGSAIALAISGSAATRICSTAAWLYSLNESAFLRIASASAAALERDDLRLRGARGPDHVGLGHTPLASRLGLALGHLLGLRALGRGLGLDPVALGVGLALDGGLELLLAALDLALLHDDLLLLLDDLDLDLFLLQLLARSCCFWMS